MIRFSFEKDLQQQWKIFWRKTRLKARKVVRTVFQKARQKIVMLWDRILVLPLGEKKGEKDFIDVPWWQTVGREREWEKNPKWCPGVLVRAPGGNRQHDQIRRTWGGLIKGLFIKRQMGCSSPMVELIPPLDMKAQKKRVVTGPRSRGLHDKSRQERSSDLG